MQAGTCILELICSPKVDVSALKAGQVDHICLECDDIDEYMKRLEGKVEVVSPIGFNMFGGAKNVFFLGPDGERIELFSTSDQEDPRIILKAPEHIAPALLYRLGYSTIASAKVLSSMFSTTTPAHQLKS